MAYRWSPVVAEPSRRPSRLEREGLGFRFNPAEAPVSIGFSRIVERREELTAEIHVQNRSSGQYEHVLRRRVNLLGSRTPADLARDLDQATDSAGWPWRRIVESAFASVVEAHRQGEDVQLLGGKKVAPPAPLHLVDGLIIQNVANTWFGPGGTGKSTAAAAACVAHRVGLPFAGRPTLKGVPLYLDWEDEEEAFESILWEVSRGYGYDESVQIHWRRMRAPIAGDIAYLSALIDRIGATLVVIDSATRAMGAAGEHGTYESQAVSFAEAIRSLGKVTTLIVDHVDSQSVKDGAAAKKAYGSIHKLNFVRNAWSLAPNEDSSEQTVGWIHAKVNRGAKLGGFGIRYRRDPVTGGLELDPLAAAEVAVVMGSMSSRNRMAEVIERDGMQSVRALALALYGEDTDTATRRIQKDLNQDLGHRFRQYSDGTVGLRERRDPTPIERPHLTVVDEPDEDDDELPF